jgi:hypothetical protein
LSSTDVIFAASGIPKHLERPAVGAVMKKASKRQAHLDRIDFTRCRSDHCGAQYSDGQVNDDALVARELSRHQWKS